jgi:hypothetical protein
VALQQRPSSTTGPIVAPRWGADRAGPLGPSSLPAGEQTGQDHWAHRSSQVGSRQGRTTGPIVAPSWGADRAGCIAHGAVRAADTGGMCRRLVLRPAVCPVGAHMCKVERATRVSFCAPGTGSGLAPPPHQRHSSIYCRRIAPVKTGTLVGTG